MTKQEIRNQIKSQFLEQKELDTKSNIICQKIINSTYYKQADILFSYMSLNDEVNLENVMKDAFSYGKKVFIPKVDVEKNNMDFYEYYGEKKETESGYCNISEPCKSALRVDLEAIKEKSILFLVPGRAFTNEGARVGRGKGFYDKYFSRFFSVVEKENVKIAGVCFDFQIVENLELCEWDVIMDEVFSEVR